VSQHERTGVRRNLFDYRDAVLDQRQVLGAGVVWIGKADFVEIFHQIVDAPPAPSLTQSDYISIP
jgi:hypothetical protein